MITPNIIYIQDLDANEFHWFDGHTMQFNSLEIIASKLSQQELIIILAGNQVYLSKVDMPNVALSQLQKAAPFALEEELAEDIETLHFAYGPIIKNQPVPVAAINKKFLSTCLSRLKEYGFIVQGCYLAPLILPITENSYSCAILENQAIVKVDSYNGFSVPIEQLQIFIELHLQTNNAVPQSIHYYDFNTVSKPLTMLAGIPVQYTQKNITEFLPMLAQQITESRCGINLMQTEFRAANKFNFTKKAWMIAGTAFAAWLIVIMLINIVSYIYYNHQQNKLEQQINAIYMQIFPDATAIVSPKIRVERELQNYQQAGSDGGFLTLLEKIGPILTNTNDITIKNLTYQNQQMMLSVQTNSFQTLQQFSNTLNSTGFIIQQTNAGNKGKFVVATLSITLPSGTL